MYVSQLQYRTACCGADLHPNCFDIVTSPCPICKVEWDIGRKPVQGKEAYCAHARKVNEEHRTVGSHYFLIREPIYERLGDYSLPFSEST